MTARRRRTLKAVLVAGMVVPLGAGALLGPSEAPPQVPLERGGVPPEVSSDPEGVPVAVEAEASVPAVVAGWRTEGRPRNSPFAIAVRYREGQQPSGVDVVDTGDEVRVRVTLSPPQGTGPVRTACVFGGDPKPIGLRPVIDATTGERVPRMGSGGPGSVRRCASFE